MKISQFSPVTLALLIASSVAYALWGPATETADFRNLPEHLGGVLRHGNTNHLALNLALLCLGGPTAEARLGPLRMLLLVAAIWVAATSVEFLLGGPGFVGLSGLAYGLVAFTAVSLLGRETQVLAVVGIAAIVVAEWALLRESVAVYTHMTGAAIGGGAAMLNSLFGQRGVRLKQMEWGHVSQVLPIIAETDEDDAREAEDVFLRDGYETMYVLMDGRTLMGVTGYNIDPAAPDVAWLSWTYLAQVYHGQGYGKTMVDDLLGLLAKRGIRKVFIETSDYEEDGVCVYAGAHRLYEEFGASLELTVPDYHEPGEAKLIYGLVNPEYPEIPAAVPGQQTGVALMGLQKAAETEDVAGIQWEEIPESLTGVDITLSNARERGFRMAVLALPQDLSEANSEALGKNFRRVGQLADFYGPQLGQDWWVVSLDDPA